MTFYHLWLWVSPRSLPNLHFLLCKMGNHISGSWWEPNGIKYLQFFAEGLENKYSRRPAQGVTCSLAQLGGGGVWCTYWLSRECSSTTLCLALASSLATNVHGLTLAILPDTDREYEKPWAGCHTKDTDICGWVLLELKKSVNSSLGLRRKSVECPETKHQSFWGIDG